MARPIKDTVDYFPHFCDHGKTMFIIEQNYGNDGYAFWFKLLELLGKTEGHFYNCNNTDDWEFLQAKTKFSEVKCHEILNKLALLGAIDKFLWEEKRIIWSDNFVRNISDAYKNRKRPVPQKPFIEVETSDTPINDIVSTGKTGVSTAEKPHSRVEENIVNKKIINHTCAREDEPVDNFSGRMDGMDDIYPSGNAAEETAATVDGDSIESSGSPDFMVFWNAYPKRSGMGKAMEAWQELMKKGVSPNDLVSAARKYALRMAADKTEMQFMKMPHNFLLQSLFVEYLPKNLASCPRCHGSGNYEVEDTDGTRIAICDCRKVLFPAFFRAVV